MKYRPSMTLAREAGEVLAETLPDMFIERPWNLLVVAPSSPITFRKRLFNPCWVMARALQKHLTIPLAKSTLLTHSKHRSPQAWLPHRERLVGASHLIRSTRSLRKGSRVLLIEDVITTGTTTAAATRALLQAGAETVDVYALARAQVWGRFRARVHHAFARTDGNGLR